MTIQMYAEKAEKIVHYVQTWITQRDLTYSELVLDIL